MIHSWDGTTGADAILGLLAYLPLIPFQRAYTQRRLVSKAKIILELYASTLSTLEEAVLCEGTPESQLRLLRFYGDLFDQWIVSLLSQSKPAATGGQAIKSMMHHVNALALTSSQTSPDIRAHSAVLDFYERSAASTMHPELKSVIRISLPPAEVIYTIHFTTSLTIQSRLCALLAIYKKAFEFAMAPPNTMKQESYSSTYVNGFNGFLMDLCNCLWRSKAFNTADPNARGCLLDPNINQILSKYVASLDNSLSLPTLFTFSYSPILCLLAISHVRELEDRAMEDIELRHAGPVSQMSLKQLENHGGMKLSWQDYRLGFLHYLERQGVPGIAELMYNTMKHLMPSREDRT